MFTKKMHTIHAPHHKNTADSIPTRFTGTKVVTIPMSMNIGAPATPVVKPGDQVKVGTLIGEAAGFVSAPIHASVSGTVKRIDDILLPNGSFSKAVVIESDGQMTNDESIAPPVITDFDSFINAIRNSGAVGLGGAGFPTAAKLKVDPDRVEYVLVNGAECEPYITADTHTMVDNAQRIFIGINTMKQFYPKAHFLIGIERNKPGAISMMRRYTDDIDRCDVVPLPSQYPQGGEKVLIYNTTKRILPEGKLPIDVGCIVINATTLSFIGKYISTGIPLVTKCVTVDGNAIKYPQNVIVPIGTPVRDIIDYVGGFRTEPEKILSGGPMMGFTLPNLDVPIMKSNNAILCFSGKAARVPEPTACIHCGRCLEACPMDLMPTELEHATIAKDVEQLAKLKVNLCMECGSCAFVCPAKRRLVESHKLGKQILKEGSVK